MPLSIAQHPWLDALNDEDVAFLKRFVLASGSLKELASVYGVSYPTIRLRLDRLVDKIRLVEQRPDADTFERSLLAAFADGKIDAATLKSLLIAHKRDIHARETNHVAAKDDARADDGNPADGAAGAGG